MKITDIAAQSLSRMHGLDEQWKTINFNSMKADASIVTIHTDEGISGIAEPSPYGVQRVIADNIARIKSELIGRDPLEPLAIGLHPNGVSLSHDCAIAGIDAALWDLRGKTEGKRVADILRPDRQALDAVRLYTSGGCNYDWHANPETLIEEVVGYLRQGFTASKIRLGTEWAWDGINQKRALELFRDLRSAVGDEFELMCDGNCHLTEEQALELGHGLDDLNFMWFLETIDAVNMQWYIRLNEALKLPVIGGEQLTTHEAFTPCLESGAYPVAQLDVGIRGLTESWRIVEAATRLGIEVCPHNSHNGLLSMMQANLMAALSHPHLLELCRHPGPLQWEILSAAPDLSDGHLHLGNEPGFGVSVAEELDERYPYVEGNGRLNIDQTTCSFTALTNFVCSR
jgi:L-alanine-DL-glutamate epimerase-like enolase superfamily enzyme